MDLQTDSYAFLAHLGILSYAATLRPSKLLFNALSAALEVFALSLDRSRHTRSEQAASGAWFGRIPVRSRMLVNQCLLHHAEVSSYSQKYIGRQQAKLDTNHQSQEHDVTSEGSHSKPPLCTSVVGDTCMGHMPSVADNIDAQVAGKVLLDCGATRLDGASYVVCIQTV